ncbi:charged multivesicular body protein 2a [Scyliorhinus torazame]|uniref:charged multivesicular body protein 2a n=1 Tax=Scyliorhinus torazame TaxID=75743 RepID=UPI003B5A1769
MLPGSAPARGGEITSVTRDVIRRSTSLRPTFPIGRGAGEVIDNNRKQRPRAHRSPRSVRDSSLKHHDAIFGRRKTPEEMLRQNQRALNRAMRELDRERQKLEQQEKKIIADIKKMAKQGQMDAVKIMAKDLVRTRRYVKKFIMMKANIQAVSLKIQTLKSNNTMAQAMKGVTKAMATMNQQLKLPQIQKIMMEFEKQSEIMDMKEEMMNDAIDDAMGDEDDEEESDAIVSQVLDELGLNLTDELSSEPPSTGASLSVAAGKKAEPVVLEDADADLEKRLKNLRKD